MNTLRAYFVGGPKCGETYEVGCNPVHIARKRAGAIVYDTYRLEPETVHGHRVFGRFVYRYEGEGETA